MSKKQKKFPGESDSNVFARVASRAVRESREAKSALKSRPKLARLNVAESRAWLRAFQYHVDSGCGPIRAGQRTWRDIQKEFPRLKKYDGARP